MMAAARLLTLLALLALRPSPVAAQSEDTGWLITSFTADYTVRADRQIEVTERIAVDFGPLQKHGIYRDIPIKYRKTTADGTNIAGGTVTVDLELLGVTDDAGQPLQTKVTRGRDARIRIGSPDFTVSGPQVYVIRYRLERGVGFFDDHDELYWQVTGTESPVPILEASATVRIPIADVDDTLPAWGAWCYAGWEESNDMSRCTAAMTQPGEYQFSVGRLDPGEGLTLVASFPKGIVPAPTVAEETAEAVGFFWPIAIPLITLLGMWRAWWTRGREPHVGSIVPRWRVPEGIRPGPAGTLLDQSADMDDIIATVLDLAVQGHLTIKEVEPEGLLGRLDEDSFLGRTLKTLGIRKTDWEFARTGKDAGGLARFEREVLDAVFNGQQARRLSDMTNSFYKEIPGITKALYDEVVLKGLFAKSPDGVRTKWIIIGVLVLFAAVPLAFVTQRVLVGVGVGVAGVIMLGFARAMPAMTREGSRRYAELKGLEEYIRRAEKLELEMHQAPKKTTELFETFLPYAVALDVSDIWVDQFASVLASQPPTWYVGSHPGHFSASAFKSSLSSFTTAATRTMGSSPGSSSGSGGGGSVGGGGGGGGVGSW